MQELMAMLAWLAFVPVYIGLLIQLRLVWQTGLKPRASVAMMAAHMGRQLGWALLGAALIQRDPVTATFLSASRIPGVILVAFLFLQYFNPRPKLTVVFLTMGPVILAIGGAWYGIYRYSELTYIKPVLEGYVFVCFLFLICYGLPMQIYFAWKFGAHGLLPWFQYAMLGNYVMNFAYAFTIPADSSGPVMIAVYGCALVLQAILVFQIKVQKVR